MPSGPFYKPGRYTVTFTGEQGFSETKNGNMQFFVEFEVTHIAAGDEWDEVTQPYRRSFYRVINANTAEYAAKDLRALGFTGESFRELDPRTANPHIFEGQAVMICNHESWDGDIKEKWSLLYEGGARKAVDMIDVKQLKQLDMLFGKALKGEKIDKPLPASVGPLSWLPARNGSGPPALPPRTSPPPTRSSPVGDSGVAAAAGPRRYGDTDEIGDDDIPF